MSSFISDLSGQEFPIAEKIIAHVVRKPIFDLITRDHPSFGEESALSVSELNMYREKYIASLLEADIDGWTEVRTNVLHALRDHTVLTTKVEKGDTLVSTRGQRIADTVASFGGSWTFILSFFAFLLTWIAVNVFWFANRAFDPYPFILLNLLLSCLAAMQAPIIMMSQNRQEEKDRERSKKDFMINLKSELEIRILHEKIDHLIMHQQKELLEIQKVQIDMMNDILRRVDHSGTSATS
jgi:uncharacterized membrane protein